MSTYQIIKDAKVFADFVPISYSYDLAEMRPHFETVAEQYLIPECGRPLWDQLTTAQDGGEMTTTQAALLAALQRPFASLCMLAHLPFIDAKISSGGITVTSSQDQAPASQARVAAIKKELWNTAYQALDRLIFFLVDNEVALGVDYDGTTYAENKRSRIVNRTEEAAIHVPSIRNRWLFRKLLPIMDRISAGEIQAAITTPIYEDILAKILEGAGPNIYDPLMPYIASAISHLSWAQGLLELGLEVSPDGALTFGTTMGTISDTGAAKLKGTELQGVKGHHERVGLTQLANAVDYLTANLGTFPLFALPEGATADHMPRLVGAENNKIHSPFL